MAGLPTLSGREVVRAFARDGWQMARQRGSHIILVKEGHMATLSVPDHKEVAKGTLRALIRSSGVFIWRKRCECWRGASMWISSRRRLATPSPGPASSSRRWRSFPFSVFGFPFFCVPLGMLCGFRDLAASR